MDCTSVLSGPESPGHLTWAYFQIRVLYSGKQCYIGQYSHIVKVVHANFLHMVKVVQENLSNSKSYMGKLVKKRKKKKKEKVSLIFNIHVCFEKEAQGLKVDLIRFTNFFEQFMALKHLFE